MENNEILMEEEESILTLTDENGEPVMRAEVLAVYVDVYYLGDLDYEAEPYGTICIYDYAAENTYGTLTKQEIAALESLS